MFFLRCIMVSMHSQRKMPHFSSNFLSDIIFRKLKVFADIWRIARNSVETVFYLNDITPRKEVQSLQEQDRMAAHFHISI